MAKVKNKAKPVHAETIKDKDRKALTIEAAKVIQQLKDTGLKQDYIAEHMNISSATLSRFMNLSHGYITKSIVDCAKKFIADRKK